MIELSDEEAALIIRCGKYQWQHPINVHPLGRSQPAAYREMAAQAEELEADRAAMRRLSDRIKRSQQ